MRRLKPGHAKSQTLSIAGGTEGEFKPMMISGILQHTIKMGRNRLEQCNFAFTQVRHMQRLAVYQASCPAQPSHSGSGMRETPDKLIWDESRCRGWGSDCVASLP